MRELVEIELVVEAGASEPIKTIEPVKRGWIEIDLDNGAAEDLLSGF